MRARVFLAVASLALGSCAGENAYLELSLELPPDPRASAGAARTAVVGVQTSDVPFDDDWQSSDAPPTKTLDGSASTKLPVSVEGRAEIEAEPVRVKIRFCASDRCDAIDDADAPEVRFEIERAFYLGQRTSLTLAVPCVPNVPGQTDAPPACDTPNRSVTNVAKCQVGGCRAGTTTSYCSNGKHFCEP